VALLRIAWSLVAIAVMFATPVVVYRVADNYLSDLAAIWVALAGYLVLPFLWLPLYNRFRLTQYAIPDRQYGRIIAVTLWVLPVVVGVAVGVIQRDVGAGVGAWIVTAGAAFLLLVFVDTDVEHARDQARYRAAEVAPDDDPL
jgi:hypothetical protein